ncbi:hypothetical protein DLH72_04145 [Candidatus Gracilibacteria bacterium]|nr:MAG: hypothetical protein DLH72_04145 [Candidatus Gracilibacteria bacterium]
MENIYLKPNKISFFVTKMIGLFLILFFILIVPVIGISIFLHFGDINPEDAKDFLSFWTYGKYIPIGIFVFLLGLCYFLLSFVYKKEEYIFSGNKLIYNYGTIFSDNSVELNIDKITEVTMVLPFIENLIFKTGQIQIKTAGSSTSKTIFSNLDNTNLYYEKVQEIMRMNGFHLQKDKLVQEAKPHPLGIFFEIGGRIGYGFVVFLIIFFENINQIRYDITSSGNSWIVIFFGIIIIIPVFLLLLFNYLDLRRRKYEVYTDSIFYTNGFLTKVYSFLPMEKVSDVDNRQGFFSKMFGLHDIIVSSEGTNNQVVFLNMVNGETLIKNIKYLKNAITLTKKELVQDEQKLDEIVGFVDKTDEMIDYNREFSAKYHMNLPRVMFSSIFSGLSLAIFISFFLQSIEFFLPIVLLSIVFSFLKGFIDVKFNTYLLEKNTIESKYEFLTNRHKTFTIDKITGVNFKENLIDKLFGTCSVQFASIGSSGFLTFSNIKKTKTLQSDILTKIGIDKNKNFEDLKVKYNLKNYILGNIASSIIIFFVLIIVFIGFFGYINFVGSDFKLPNFNYIFLFLIAIIFIFPILEFLYGKIAYSSRFYLQRIYENFYESKKGIIFQTQKYSLFKNIKGMTSTKYPFSNDGNLVLDIAGDIVLEGDDKQKISFGGMKISSEYLENIYSLQNKLDSTIFGKEISEEILEKSEQSIWNSTIVQIAIVSIFFIIVLFLQFGSFDISENELKGLKIIFISLLFFSILGLAIRIWYIKSKYYLLQKDRLLLGFGIIYKSKRTILYDRINFVEKNQGFLGKIFGNGTVQVYTVGSGMVDLIFTDTEDFRKIYDKLKKD